MAKHIENDLEHRERGRRPADSQETWAASRAQVKILEKQLMAHHFANHDFLLPDGASPAKDEHETAASIFINQGTGPNVVAQESLKWIEEHAGQGPFHITWYSTGTLVSATLHEFRQRKPHLSAATHIHLFPGTVDLQLQAQIGKEAQEYARNIKRRFSYMILSGHSFDVRTGGIGFHFDREIPIQRTCALLEATQKFLFFDSSKFTGEGEVGYSIRDLLATSNAVILYTASSDRSKEIKKSFEALAADLLSPEPQDGQSGELKSLRLTIVGQEGVPTDLIRWPGYLRAVHGAALADATSSVASGVAHYG